MDDEKIALKATDFASDQEVRWCPGCGDYAILKAVQKTLAEINAIKENTVFVSGIGCASRLPYYMSTYGFHTIHGRAPAIATGIKLANPDLDVWIVTGDGDGLSIGGNHLLHILRRNIDCQILLFNNETYGLTKGQYSPSSRIGTSSPSSPRGSIERPLLACSVAIGAGATFIARGIDTSIKELINTFKAAESHKGASFIEILQNCIVYNDNVFSEFKNKSLAKEKQIHLEHGKKMIFGLNDEIGIALKPNELAFTIVNSSEPNILIHDASNINMANMLINMKGDIFPTAFGVIYSKSIESFDDKFKLKSKNNNNSIEDIINIGQTWEVK